MNGVAVVCGRRLRGIRLHSDTSGLTLSSGRPTGAGMVFSLAAGYLTPSLVSQAYNSFGGQLKGLMTWSINWDGSKSWTFGDNVKALQGR